MELFEGSSNLIFALGKTVLNSLWLGLLSLSLLKAFFLLIPQRFAGLRYHAALFSLLIFSTLSIGLFLYFYNPIPENSMTISQGSLSGVSAFQLAGEGRTASRLLYQSISLIYFTGVAIYIISTILAMGKISTLRREARSVTGKWGQRFNDFKLRAGIGKKVEFLVSERAVSPFLTGMLKPAIIVPAAMFSQLSFSELEAILMHELFHLKRLDHVVNLLQRIVEMLFFFNPAVWILSKIIRNEREKYCDDLVMATHSHPLDYARALYSLSMLEQDSLCQVTAATGHGKGELKNRIERILNPNTMNTNFREKINALLLITCGLIIVLLVSGFTSGFSITRYNELPDEVQQPIVPAATEPVSVPPVSTSPVSVPPAFAPPVSVPPAFAPPAFAPPAFAPPVSTSPAFAPPVSVPPVSVPPVSVPPVTIAIPHVQAPVPDQHAFLLPVSTPDTLTEEEKDELLREVNEAIEGVEWENFHEAMEDVDWGNIHEAMEDVDWENIQEAMEDVDWENIHEAMEELDWENFHEAMEDLDWENFHEAMEDVDWENIQEEIHEAMEDVDWEQIKIDLEKVHIQIDSVMTDIDIDLDIR